MVANPGLPGPASMELYGGPLVNCSWIHASAKCQLQNYKNIKILCLKTGSQSPSRDRKRCDDLSMSVGGVQTDFSLLGNVCFPPFLSSPAPGYI